MRKGSKENISKENISHLILMSSGMLQDLSSLTDQKLKQQKEAAGNSTV